MTQAPEGQVALVRSRSCRYLDDPPFHPAENYPESPFPERAAAPNPAYEAVRRALRVAGYDAPHFSTPAWNPLGELIRPGETVLLKPNLVKHRHPRDPEGWRWVLTHGSVIRAVCDYVVVALQGRGRIWLADAPHTDSSWEGIVRVLSLDRIAAFYKERGLEFELVDLRRQEWSEKDGVVLERRDLPGDPRGYVAFDLAQGSEFRDHDGAGRYYGADYSTAEVNLHHTGGRHEYLISGSAIQADVFINLPKMKTHKKAGITCSLKNLVGINGDKNWLPHVTLGDVASGGDEIPRLTLMRRVERAGVRMLRRAALEIPVVGPRLFLGAKRVGRLPFGDTEAVVRSGNWHGNDTTWRMCLDLNKLLLYGSPDGTLRPAQAPGRKRYLSIVDGLMAGEGRGPMNPDLVEAGVLMLGEDPAAVDAACAVLMGFDLARLPVVREAFKARGWPIATVPGPAQVRVVSDVPAWNAPLENLDPSTLFRFRPHFGWEGHLEAAWRAVPRAAQS
jgi:uncharacterized protein (DUF362 family)